MTRSNDVERPGGAPYKNLLRRAMRLIRIFHRMTRVELAEKMGVDSYHISDIEFGDTFPTPDDLALYEKAFNLGKWTFPIFDETKPGKLRIAAADKMLSLLEWIERA